MFDRTEDAMLILNRTTSANVTSFNFSGNATAMDQYANVSGEAGKTSGTAAYWMTLTGVIVGSIVALLGTIGNGATIEAYRRNRKLQTTFNHLITNLCAIDLIYSAVVMPLVLTMVGSGEQVLPDHVCTALGFAYYCSISASVVNLVFIAINRYVGIVHSAQYRKVFSKDCIKWWLAAVWLSTPLLYLPFLIFDSFEWRESSLRCALSSKMTSRALKYYHIAVNALLQILPAIALVVLYRAILLKVKRCRKSVEHHPTIFSATPTGGDPNESSKAAGGRRPSVSRATSPVRPSVDNNTSSQILPDKKSTMSYLQVPSGAGAATQPAGSTVREKRRSFSFRRRNVSSPDLTSSEDEAGPRGRRERASWRRRSWGDKPDAKSNGGMLMAMRARSSTLVTESVRMQGTMLSTIDSEPTSKNFDQSELPETVTTTTNENTTSVECLSTPSVELLEKCTCRLDAPGLPNNCSLELRPPAFNVNVNLKLPQQNGMKEDGKSRPKITGSEARAFSTLRLMDSAAQREELPGFKMLINADIGIGTTATASVECSTQSNSNQEAVTQDGIPARKRLKEIKLNTLPKKHPPSRSHHKLYQSQDSLYVPPFRQDLNSSQRHLRTSSEPMSRRLQRPLSRTPSIGGLSDSDAPIKVDERPRSELARTRRLREKRSFTDPWKKTWSSLSFGGRGKRFRKRARSEGVAKFPAAIFSPSTPKIVIDHATSEDMRASVDHAEITSTSSMIEDFVKRSRMEASSDSVENKDCKWCKNLITKLLKPHRRTSQDSSQRKEQQDESGSSPNRKTPSSVDKTHGVDEEMNLSVRNDSFTVVAGIHSGEFVSDERAWSVGSRVYRYSIGGGDECASRVDSVSCAGYEYTTTRTHLQRDASKDLGASFQQQKRKRARRHLSIYNSWRRKSFLTSSVHSSLSNDSRRRQRRRDAERHLAYSGMIICAAFALCVLPTSVISVLGGLLRVEVTPTVKFAAGMLSWLHAVVNPLLYGFLNPKYRLEFRRMYHDVRYFYRTCRFCCCCGRMDRSASHGSQASIASGLRNSWNPSSWFDSTRRPSNVPQRV